MEAHPREPKLHHWFSITDKHLSMFQACLTVCECSGEATQANVRCYMRNTSRPPCGTQQHAHVERLDGRLDSVVFLYVSAKLEGSEDCRVATSASVLLVCRQTGSRAAADDGLCVRGPSGSHGFSLSPSLSVPSSVSLLSLFPLLSFLSAPSLAASATSLPHMQQHAAVTGFNHSQGSFTVHFSLFKPDILEKTDLCVQSSF